MKNNNGLLALDEQLKSVLSGEKHENAPNMVSTPPIIEQQMSITTTTNPNIQQQPTQSFNNTGDLPIHLPTQQQQQPHQNQQQFQLPNIIDSSVLNFSPSASINRRNSVDVKVIASFFYNRYEFNLT